MKSGDETWRIFVNSRDLDFWRLLPTDIWNFDFFKLLLLLVWIPQNILINLDFLGVRRILCYHATFFLYRDFSSVFLLYNIRCGVEWNWKFVSFAIFTNTMSPSFNKDFFFFFFFALWVWVRFNFLLGLSVVLVHRSSPVLVHRSSAILELVLSSFST